MPARALPRIPAVWLVLASIACIQVGASVAKGLFDEIPPIAVTWLRVLAAAAMLVPTVRPWRALPRRGEPEAARRWWLLAGFTICLLVMNVAIYQSFSRIPMGVAITVEFLGPLAVAVMGSRRALDLLWVVLAGAGVALLSLAPARIDVVGLGLALLAGAAWAGYILVGTANGSSWRPVDLLALGCAGGAVALAPFAIAAAGAALWTPRALLTGLVVGLMSTVLPYTLELSAMRHIPKATFGIMMSIEPAMAALAAFVILHEALGLVDLVAMACVIAASVGSTRTQQPVAA